MDEHAPRAAGAQVSKHRHWNYDPTINLGHVITFMSMLALGATAYFDLRERVTVNELRQQVIEAEQAAEKARIRDSLTDIRIDLRDVKRGIEQLARPTPPRPN